MKRQSEKHQGGKSHISPMIHVMNYSVRSYAAQ